MRDMLLALGVVFLATFPALGADAKPADEDPWIGKTRTEVVEMLGEPQKVKGAGRDGEKLTYKFFRIDPEAPPPLDLRLIPVPGLGMVGQVETTGLGNGQGVAIGPTEFDKYGRPSGGGIGATESTSASYDPKSGRLERSGVQGSAVSGKVKLLLTVGADGRVTAWSVSGKK